MSDLRTIADCLEIEALRGEFTNAEMTCDYDRFRSLFTQDGRVADPPTTTSSSSAGRRSAAGSSSCTACGTASCRLRGPTAELGPQRLPLQSPWGRERSHRLTWNFTAFWMTCKSPPRPRLPRHAQA